MSVAKRRISGRRMDASARWMQVVNDTTGIDNDIECLIRSLQQEHGFSREIASAELVRRIACDVL